ncbi:MAG: alpha-hydroxy-acid oxidizing protein [Chloroflexi bacterium]|nr:alpha-hydroxy-acid oxidizing protein [Chloroflexota bacterium]
MSSADRTTATLDAVVTLADFEPIARGRMAGPAFDYVAGGSWDEVTLVENETAWQRFRFIPRVLRDVRTIDVAGAFLGRRSTIPVAVAPMAVQGMAHPDGEVEAVRGAAAAGIPYILSTSSSRTMEEVAEAAPDAERWFQLYTVRSLEYSRTLVERAEAAGYRALMVTVDLPVLGRRERDVRSGFALPAMPHVDPAAVEVETGRYGGLELQRGSGMTWGRIEEMAAWSSMPMILKGILSPDDAARAAELGMAAIVVSNHGGRQLDRAVTAPDVLEAIVRAVDGRCEVWADGGIRRALDVLVALALGARGVLVGRPFYWALAAAGQAGVEQVVELLRDELELALPMLGCASVDEVGRELVVERTGSWNG